ncbi:MAG TPA: hypothetical protein VFQ53_21915 [Kofleriaceae bacterium]|nr:hypothetical protein [Kofleriaceae bacterium]
MDIASSGAFRYPATRAGRAALLATIVCVLGVAGFAVWKRWLRIPAPETICDQLAAYDENERIDAAVFSVLADDRASATPAFEDRCLWYFDSMRDVDRDYYGGVARCVTRADDADDAIACTYSP